MSQSGRDRQPPRHLEQYPFGPHCPSVQLTNASPVSISLLKGSSLFEPRRGPCYATDCLFSWGDVFLRPLRLGLTTWDLSIAPTIQKTLRFSENQGRLPR